MRFAGGAFPHELRRLQPRDQLPFANASCLTLLVGMPANPETVFTNGGTDLIEEFSHDRPRSSERSFFQINRIRRCHPGPRRNLRPLRLQALLQGRQEEQDIIRL